MNKVSERDAVRTAYGCAVRVLRKRIGLGQERLALEAHVDRSYMSGLERGLHTPNLETVIRFLPFLKVTFPEFATEFEKCLRKARRGIKDAPPG